MRTDGSHATLTYKEREVSSDPTKDERIEEIETDIGDFSATEELLRRIGMFEKHSQEKKRTRWKKGGVVYDIDTWPMIPTFLEIEGSEWGVVDEAIRELGYDPAAKKICSADQIYEVYGISWADYSRIAFDGSIKRDAPRVE